MTQIAALPTLDVYIAFNPTSGATLNTANQQALPASGASNSYWTNVTIYVQDFQTKAGRQHFLDRVEASTLNMTFNNRTGFFTGSPNVLDVRMPIAVKATWNGTPYNVYWGLTDSVTEQIIDQLNSELVVSASDLTKLLSLKYMASANFWPSYVQTSSLSGWFRCDPQSTATVTQAIGNGTNVTYNATNNFVAGQHVTITGLSPSGYNVTDQILVGTPTATSFTVANTTTGGSQGTGTAYTTTVVNAAAGGTNGIYEGVVSFQPNGAMVYSPDGCVDLADGSTTGSGYVNLLYQTGMGGIDFWILGQGLGYSVIANFGATSGSTALWLKLYVSSQGTLLCEVQNSGGIIGSIIAKQGGTHIQINDGYWHHVGLVCDSSGNINLYCDGTYSDFSSLSITPKTLTSTIFGTSYPLYVGADIFATGTTFECPALLDEIVINNTSSLSTLQGEVSNRYIAGSLLQLGFPVDGLQYTSADRIAEILTIAGFGYVSGNAIVLNSGVFSVNGSPYSYLTNQGAVVCQPYYWDAPITGSTALDLILEVTDTDIGAFFQTNTGVFEFYTQNYYGTWTWNSSTNTGSWALNGTGSTAVSTWTDTNTGVPYYGPTLQTSRDDADLWTTVNVTPQAGAEQIYENTAQESRYGYSTLSKSSTVNASSNSALSTANYLGYLYRSPIPRVQNVELRAETVETNVSSRVVGYYNPTLLGTPFGTVINFQRTPPNAAGAGIINYNYVVESISHDFQADPGQWHVSFILDPYPVRS